jgi:putative Holliday junction resolvase
VSAILAVDYGRRRIGLAVTDALRIAGQGLPTLVASGRSGAIREIAALVADREVAEVVVGLPLNMNGTRGPMAEEAQAFADALREATGVRVVCWDERLTTESAKRALRQAGGHRKRKKGQLDQMAATLMLNDYLQSRSGAEMSDEPS